MPIHLNLVDYPQLSEQYTDFGRMYTNPNGDVYPSITTVLGKQPKPGLDAWRERVGDDKAERMMKASGRVGSEFHDACERFILGDAVGVLSLGATMLFAAAKSELNHLHDIRGIEIPMWSDALKTAGRSDLIGSHRGVPSVVDYKNSRSAKPKEFCTDYFMQGAAYARMFYERYGIIIKQMVIIIAVWGQVKPTVHIEPVSNWVKPLNKVMELYNPLWKN